MRVVNLRAGVGERVDGPAQQGAVFRVDGAGLLVEPRRDAETGQRRRGALRELDSPRDRIVGTRTGEHRHEELEVLSGSRHRTEYVDVGARRPAAHVIEVAEVRDDAVARLQREYAAAVRGCAHRPTDVSPELGAGETSGERRRGSA